MKAAYMPFHSWLPTAMVAPTPVSALLHAVAVVKAGVFGIIRVVCYIYGINLIQELGLGVILACFISFTVIVANLFAIREDNLKKRLAYSTINQLAFIILGASLLSPLSLKGSMIHIFFHAFMKITLFMCAGTITAITGMKYISEMKGIGKAMPITSISFIIGALGMCGLPPAAGFISKWFIGLGAIDSGYTIFLFVILIASLLDAVYFFPIIWTILFDELDKGNFDKIKTKIKDNKISVTLMVLPLLITAIASVLFFIFPDTLGVLNLADIAVNNLFCIYGG
jgi:formate hydrogenlyase subunit 3/multisubunit Na+/H+ antiporter MnhD subunit